MNISAAMVKDLREKTGVGMMDCKTALIENNGDMEAAVDWLRAKGLAKAAKKAGRVAAEGLVGVAVKGASAAVVEVNSETDFVARNDAFQGLVRTVAAIAVENGGDHAATSAATYPGKSHSVEAEVKELVATIGENMNFRRSAGLTVSAGVVAPYVHAAIADGLGKIGVLVALESTGNTDELLKLGRQVAMHVAATNPLALSAEDVDAAVVERERAIFVEQAKESGKPAQVIEKMVEGRIRKFLRGVHAPEAGLRDQPGPDGRGGREGGRGHRRRSDQGHRLRALRARRGHREGRDRLRRRSGRCRRHEVTSQPSGASL